MRALEGLRIADFSWAWAGPYSTKLLADMGAEVIKFETSRRLDLLRWWPPLKENIAGVDRSAYHGTYNRGKLSCTLDLSKPKAVEIAKQIVKISDIVAENFSPRVMRGFGLNYEALREIKPDLVMVSIAGYGATGPYKDYISYGLHAEYVSGLASLTGRPDGPPVPHLFAFPDPAAGVMAALGALVALRHRNRTGEGQHIDLSQNEVIASFLPEGIMEYTMNQKVRPRMASDDGCMAPHGVYRCKGDDKWVTIAVATDQEWRAFCTVIGHSSWMADVGFANSLSRWENREQLDRLVEEWTRERDQHEITALFQQAGIAAAPVLDAPGLLEDEHLKSRDFFVDDVHPVLGEQKIPGVAWKLSHTPGEIQRHAPLLGEHNDYVLGELLGLPKREIARLVDDGVVC